MRPQLNALVIASLVAATPALAKEIMLPASGPKVSFVVPDDWTRQDTDLGFEAASPQANSTVFAKVMRRGKDDQTAWVRSVLRKLESRGIKIVKTHEPAEHQGVMPLPIPVPIPVPAPVLTPSLGTKAVERPSDVEVKKSAPETSSVTPKITPPPASAAKAEPIAPVPSMAQPPATFEPPKTPAVEARIAPEAPKAVPEAPALPPPAPLPTFTMNPALTDSTLAPVRLPKPLPRYAVRNRAVTKDGTPVDVELVTFGLPDKSVFVVLQESGETDERAIGIIKSVLSTE